ncbi:MAG: hypothetical protein IPI06_01340 [Gammaproteobacteria bacterium]|nr:hypothetical protein [Gammaproteobacteria bacterium]
MDLAITWSTQLAVCGAAPGEFQPRLVMRLSTTRNCSAVNADVFGEVTFPLATAAPGVVGAVAARNSV